MDYSMENLKIVTAPYYRSYLPDGRNTYMPVVFCDEYFVDLYLAPERLMISNYGRLYSKSRKMMLPINHWYCDGNPCYDIIPTNHQSAIRFRICDLVANVFVPNPNPSVFTQVHHKNTDLNNNYYLNLQWVDPNNIPQPDYTYDRSEAVKCVYPNEPAIFDYNQFKYASAKSITGKGFLVHFADEVFKPVPGHPMYQVSNYGRVYSDYKKCILTPCVDKDGYLRVSIDGLGRGVHRLVAFAFYDPSTPNYGDQVNHKDGIKHNNHISNLEWCTCMENIHHAMDTGLRKDYGENNYWSTHSDAQVEKECQLLAQGYRARDIARILGIPWDLRYSDHITKLRRKEVCTHISDKYDYPRYSHKGYQLMARSNASQKTRDFSEN